MRVETVRFGGDRFPLEGTLSLPDAPFSLIAFFIGGSGPVTREGIVERERIPGAKPPFEVWAEHLAKVGLASFRYDKRASAYARAYRERRLVATGIGDEYIDDLKFGWTAVSARVGPTVARVLLGHSLGGVAALMFSQHAEGLKGVITVNAPIRSFTATVSEQLQRLGREDLRRQIENSQAENNSEIGPLGVPASYWREYASIDLLTLVRRQSVPVLLVQGRGDRLANADDFEFLQRRLSGLHGVECGWAEGDHFLMTRPPKGPEDSGDYNLDIIIKWLEERGISPDDES